MIDLLIKEDGHQTGSGSQSESDHLTSAELAKQSESTLATIEPLLTPASRVLLAQAQQQAGGVTSVSTITTAAASAPAPTAPPSTTSTTSPTVHKYAECISAAGGDVNKMQRCASLLGGGNPATTTTASLTASSPASEQSCPSLTDGEGGGVDFTQISGASCSQAQSLAKAWAQSPQSCGTGATGSCSVSGFACTATERGPGRVVSCVDSDRKITFNAM
jgi:hypothetical protein